MSEQPAYRLIAAAFESPEALTQLLASEPDLLESRTGLGETPLHYLAVENQLRAIVLLVESGAQVNTINSVGGTPLSEAASLGYDELVEFLLAKGASLSLPDQHELTLHEAARSGSAGVVELILGAGASVDETNDLGETALHLASEEDKRLPALRVLLQAGADPARLTAFKETALDIALRENANACAGELALHGAPHSNESAA